MTHNTDPVRALIEKWRNSAENGVFTGGAGPDIRETLMECAGDLESALRAKGQEETPPLNEPFGNSEQLAEPVSTAYTLPEAKGVAAGVDEESALASAPPSATVGVQWDMPCGECSCGVYDARAFAAFDGTFPKCKRFDRYCVGAIHCAQALAAQQPAGVDEAPDPSLLRFYGVSDYPSLVAAMEEHVLKLIDTHKRNVKPWEDTFPPTLLPKWVREQGVVPTEEGLALAQKWEDEAAESWGEDDAHRAKQECCDELRGLLTAALAAQQSAAVDRDVAWILLRGSQGEPAGTMTVSAKLQDGSEVVLIRDSGNVIDHAVNLAAALAAQQQGGRDDG